jgi:hypothetical protein
MLTIRKVQKKAFSAYIRQSFEDRMVRHLAAAFPRQFKAMTSTKSEDQPVRALIRQGIDRAERYQIVSRRDVARFIEVTVAVDPRFDDRKDMAWARQILEHADFTGQGKMDLIYQRLRDPEHAHLLQNHHDNVPSRQ